MGLLVYCAAAAFLFNCLHKIEFPALVGVNPARREVIRGGAIQVRYFLAIGY